jgi:Concanavalin A-like lectin/glucanases superfamily
MYMAKTRMSSIKGVKPPQIAGPPLPTPVRYYPFNGDILDYATGTGVSNATAVGGTPTFNTTSSYKPGSSSLIMTGSNSILLPSITLSNNMTFCMWFSPTARVPGTTIFYYNSQFAVQEANNDNINVVNSGGNINNIGGTIWQPTAWNHVAIVVSGNSCACYVNGVYKLTGTLNTGVLTGTVQGKVGAGLLYNFSGNVNGYRVYNSSLTAAQISTIYYTPM